MSTSNRQGDFCPVYRLGMLHNMKPKHVQSEVKIPILSSSEELNETEFKLTFCYLHRNTCCLLMLSRNPNSMVLIIYIYNKVRIS